MAGARHLHNLNLTGPLHHPRFFDEQLGSAVGAIDYVRGSGN